MEEGGESVNGRWMMNDGLRKDGGGLLVENRGRMLGT